MRRLLSGFILVSSVVLETASSAGNIDTSLAPMLKNVLPAVVNIKALIKISDIKMLRELQKQHGKPKTDKDGGDDEQDNHEIGGTFVSIGSGVIVDANKGYILTNSHVVADAQKVTITLDDGHHYTAKTLGMDKPSDVALLQIDAKNLTALPMRNTSDMKVGDFVAAIGNPFGLNQTVTSGIVSAMGRSTLGIENYENFIQTDAPINPGNSGGALVDMQGRLVGINTAILAPEKGSVGIGFAIPANMAKSVMVQLLQYGNVKRGVIGIGAQNMTPELTAAFNTSLTQGAVITQVLPDSPASQAGMLVGDIITSVNGETIKTASDVVNTVGFLRVDSKVNVKVMRNNKPVLLNVALSDPKIRKEKIEQHDPFLNGVALKNFTLLSPVHGDVKGVLVASVEEDSHSWQSDLRTGDVITSINQQKITNINELKAAAAKAKKTMLVNILRGGGAFFLVINLEA